MGIVAGGLDENDEESDTIHVLDIRDNNNYTLRKSSINCPKSGEHNIVGIGGGLKDELLVIGWIKCLFSSSQFIDLILPPLSLMQLIAMWYNQEMIHWIETQHDEERNDGDHFA